MKIVLTNDDGIDAPGLAALQHVCEAWGDTVIVAPDLCHSALGHRVTTGEPFAVVEESPTRYRIHGTPADCTRVALHDLVPDAALVIAGINRGGNLGADIYSSGTVAAAREAALMGRRAIAISHYVARGRTLNWQAAERRAASVLGRILHESEPSGRFWNINLPHPADDDLDCEIVFCPLDPSAHDVRFERTGELFRYRGDYHSRPRIPGHDVAECFSGKITVTALE